MTETFLLILLLFPSMLGIAELMHLAKVYIISPKSKPKKVVIVYLYGEYALEQLRLILEEYSWHGKNYAQQIVAVDCGIVSEQYKECESFARNNKIIFCKEENLVSVFKTD